MERKLKLIVHADRCQGHNRCRAFVPQLIDLDDLGNAQVVGDGVVPAALREAASLAQANCPELALLVVDE